MIASKRGRARRKTSGTVNLARRAEIGRSRRNKTEQKLLRAAARVVAERGESTASIEQFIEAAGVARGTFYNYFNSRDAVIDALWSRVGSDPLQEIRNHCASITDPAEKLATELRLALLRTDLDHVWGWLVISLASSQRVMSHELSLFPTTVLAQGLAAGRFRYTCAEAARDLVVATTLAGMKAYLTRRPSADYAEALCRMTLLAIGVRRSDAATIANLPLPDLHVSVGIR